MAIDFYTPKYWELNNFSANAIHFNGQLYPTAEHAYQAAKFSDPAVQAAIRAASSPRQAKHIAHYNYESDIHPDWHTHGGVKKLNVMEQILRAKSAQHPEIDQLLLRSGAEVLEERSPTDYFWGTGPDASGQNHLGRLWMKLRAEQLAKKP